jgi:hypothetical protein
MHLGVVEAGPLQPARPRMARAPSGEPTPAPCDACVGHAGGDIEDDRKGPSRNPSRRAEAPNVERIADHTGQFFRGYVKRRPAVDRSYAPNPLPHRRTEDPFAHTWRRLRITQSYGSFRLPFLQTIGV